VLWLDAASFMVSATLFAIAVPASPAEPRTSPTRRAGYLADLRSGLSYLRADRLIRAIVVMVAITNFLDAPAFAVLLPVYARETVGTATALGFMVAAFAAGAIVSALVFGAVGDRLPRRASFIALFASASTPFWVLSASPPYWAAIAALFFGGLMGGALNPIILTVAQERIPRHMRGRIFGLMVAVAYTAVPVGMILAGYLAEIFSVTSTLLLIAILYVVVTTVQIFNPALRQMDHPHSVASGDLAEPPVDLTEP
jgi:MFS family permease